MAQLGRFRSGWENEHLASFLLSRIAFLANPITVADDIGSDFFCTLFEVVEVDSLFPRSSFAIQIKSSRGKIDAKKQIEYFEKLELPFFVGVIDQGSLKLSIYSGEYLPILFSHFGRPQALSPSHWRIIRSPSKTTMRTCRATATFSECPMCWTSRPGRIVQALSSKDSNSSSYAPECIKTFRQK